MKKAQLAFPLLVGLLLVAGIFVASAYSGSGQAGKTSTQSSQTEFSTSLKSTTASSSAQWSYYSIQIVSVAQAMNVITDAPTYASVFRSNNTIVFSGSEITIYAAGMMPEDAINLTGMSPPGYATDDVFVISGLIDPTLVVPSGAHVDIVFVNLDDDMYHNFVATSLAPPYPNIAMQGMMLSNNSNWYGGMYGGMMGGYNTVYAMMMPVLSPANYSHGTAYYYGTSWTLNSYGGGYWYICTYPGHAESGMYGRIIVSS